MMARVFNPSQHQRSTNWVASFVEESTRSAQYPYGNAIRSADGLFRPLSSGSDVDPSLRHQPHQSHPTRRHASSGDDEVDCDETKMSSPNDPLVIKLAAFEARGWIARSEYMHYRRLLKDKDYEQRRLVQSKLGEIAARHHEVVSEAGPPAPILYKGNQASFESTNRGRSLRVSWEDESDTSNKENGRFRAVPMGAPGVMSAAQPVARALVAHEGPRQSRPHISAAAKQDPANSLDTKQKQVNTDSIILEPSYSWKKSAPITGKEIKNLFVEMCFFARLGFVQPPCCMKCVYSQVMASTSSDQESPDKKTCQRWVVWREDASVHLHPNKLDGNIVILPCHVAGKLLHGHKVEGRTWDAARRQLISMQ